MNKIRTGLDLEGMIRLIRVVPEKLQHVVVGIAGDELILDGSPEKIAEFIREWEDLTLYI